MRVTKQRTYGNKLTYRALTMNDLVDWIAGSPSEQPIQTFRERLRYAYPNKSYTFTRKYRKSCSPGLSGQVSCENITDGYCWK